MDSSLADPWSKMPSDSAEAPRRTGIRYRKVKKGRGTKSGEFRINIEEGMDPKTMAEELEALKVEIMSSMVHAIKYNVGDSVQTSQVVYFTNRQALGVSQQQMPKVRQALHIKEPKLVIRLLPSTGPANFWKTCLELHPELAQYNPTKKIPERTPEARSGYHANASLFWVKICKLASFGHSLPDAQEAIQVEQRLTLIAKEVLLPLAFKSNALIVGSSCCSLTQAFAKVSAPVQHRYGEDCPFRMVIFDHAPFLFGASDSNQDMGALEVELRSFNQNWERTDFTKALIKKFGHESRFWPCHSPVEGAGAYIIFESLATKRADQIDIRAGEQFLNKFVASLQSYLPVVALWTCGDSRLSNIGQAADHVSYRLPLILLDSRSLWRREVEKPEGEQSPNPRDDPLDLDTALEKLHGIADGLRDMSQVDTYTVSALALVRRALDSMRRQQLTKNRRSRGAGSGLNLAGDQEDPKMLWLWQAIELARGKDFSQEHEDDAIEQHSAGAVANEAVGRFLRYVGEQQFQEAQVIKYMREGGINGLRKATTYEELQKLWIENLQKMIYSLAHCPPCLFERSIGGMQLVKEAYTKNGTFGEVVELNLKELQDHGLPFDMVHAELMAALEEVQASNARYDEREKQADVFLRRSDLWLSVYDILASDVVYSCGIDKIDRIKELMSKQARSERLPDSNTLEGLLLLQSAWTLTDLFHSTAGRFKWLAKSSYVLVLVLGVVMVCMIALETYGTLDMRTAKNVVLSLALLSGALKAWTSFSDPMNKWLKLRSGSVMLQAEIWKFRTRVGNYASVRSLHQREAAERLAETNLQDVIRAVRSSVLEGSGLSQTKFYSISTVVDDAQAGSRIPPSLPGRHFQHNPRKVVSPVQVNQDNHHSPVSPDEYICWRITPSLNFYQQRVPLYARLLTFLQVVSLGSSLVTTVLAAFDGFAFWTPLVVAIASAFAAWQEFGAAGKKLQRYSTAIDTLSSLILWWKALPAVDKADARNIERLVSTSEATIAAEHTAWLSDALKAQRLVEQAMSQEHQQSHNEEPEKATE